MSKPCNGCNEEEKYVYRKGKIQMRFKRAGRKVGMIDYVDGKIYWMYPRHARYAWWEPVDVPKMPVVPEATEKESVFEPTGATGSFQRIISEDTSGPATIGESGYILSPSGIIEGKFQEPEKFVDKPVEVIMPQPPAVEPEEEKKELGFPEGQSPSKDWTKNQLLAYIQHRGGVGKRAMRHSWLVEIAQNLRD